MTRLWEIPVRDPTRVRDVRVAAEAAGAEAGLGPERTATLDLVVTELATNLLKHSEGGRVLIDLVVDEAASAESAAPPTVQILAIDHGPGMRDVGAALSDGYSTSGSLGAGLGACRRLADTFELHSAPGRGTVALARLAATRPPAADASRSASHRVRVGGLRMALHGAEVSGDAWTWARRGNEVTLLLADGLGHGPAAATAADAAVAAIRSSPVTPPVEALRRVDAALRGTRGAAVAIAQLDPRAGALRFAGLGNIGARVNSGGDWRPLVSHPGVAGAYGPAVIPSRQARWDDDSVLVLHSDGLPSRWQPPHDRSLRRHDPAVIAAVILRDASSAALPVRDDTTIVVMTSSPPDGAS